MRFALFVLLLMLAVFPLASCSSSASQPAPQQEAALFQQKEAAPLEESEAEPFTFTDAELGFSFTVPENWNPDDYKIIVSHGDMEDGSGYSQVDFIFQSDRENPLLTILIVSPEWWRSVSSSSTPHPVFLAEQGGTVYCFQLPQGCPYADEQKSGLYNSMVLEPDQVPLHFSLTAEEASAESR